MSLLMYLYCYCIVGIVVATYLYYQEFHYVGDDIDIILIAFLTFIWPLFLLAIINKISIKYSKFTIRWVLSRYFGWRSAEDKLNILQAQCDMALKLYSDQTDTIRKIRKILESRSWASTKVRKIKEITSSP